MVRYRLVFAPLAEKQLRRLTKVVQLRVVSALGRLAEDPHLGKRLRGELKEYWSYRVGDYRIVYYIRQRAIQVEIIRIAHRREVYQ